MTDAEVIAAAKEIVAAIGTKNWLHVYEQSKYRLPELARLVLAHDAALAEARAVPEMSDLIKEQIGVDISHDLRCALTESDGLNRVRWNNKAMLMLMRECNRLSVTIAELRAENERLKKLIESYGNNPAGFDWGVLGEIDQLETDRDRLLAALRPFAALADDINPASESDILDACKDARDLIAEHEAKP